MDSYKLGVNAYVVKPVDFNEFMKAVKELGVFWALINEPPPAGEKAGAQKMKAPCGYFIWKTTRGTPNWCRRPLPVKASTAT